MRNHPLRGRRIQIAGSTLGPENGISSTEIDRASQFVEELVKSLLKAGACFVIPVDAEKMHSNGTPVCFDWLVWKTIFEHQIIRPTGVDCPLAIAVKHHKNEEQIPSNYLQMWDRLKGSPLVQIESAAQWNMNSKRMDVQATHGDILIALGGGEGVVYLANLYHATGKPVIPVNFPISTQTKGTQMLFDFGVTGENATKLFRLQDGSSSHHWLNKIEITNRKTGVEAAQSVFELLENLTPPEAFIVRLLNPEIQEFVEVERYFSSVVQPVIEHEMGFHMNVVDGRQTFETATIDKEIFEKLHRASVAIVDITGARPNCFIELGYALGQGKRTVLLTKKGTHAPFDVTTYAAHHWDPTKSVDEQKREFRDHWNAIQKRPNIVKSTPLIQ